MGPRWITRGSVVVQDTADRGPEGCELRRSDVRRDDGAEPPLRLARGLRLRSVTSGWHLPYRAVRRWSGRLDKEYCASAAPHLLDWSVRQGRPMGFVREVRRLR